VGTTTTSMIEIHGEMTGRTDSENCSYSVQKLLYPTYTSKNT
jgi:hypothetical protein